MSTQLKLIAASLAAGIVAACIGMDPQSVIRLESRGDAFDRALHAEYAELAIRESGRYDWSSATRFAHKAEAAAAGVPVAPEMPEIWGISSTDPSPIRRAREQLMAALGEPGVRAEAPDLAAAAQASFDCWVEETSEGRPETVESCRERWRMAMADLAIAAPPAVLPAAAPVVRIRSPQRFEVFFTAGSADLDPASEARIARLLDQALTHHTGTIRVVGHTDRVGPADLNERLAWSRAGSVADALVEAGIPVAQIELLGLGEAAPAVPTPDEMPHPLNRRAVIELL